MRDDRRCTAKSKRSQRRCLRAAIRGGTVCAMHGGGSPQARRSAAERVAALVVPAIDAQARLLRCSDKGAASRTASDILNRAGIRADTYTAAQVMSFVQGITDLFLEVVEDPHLRREFARGLRRKLPPGADVGMPLDPPGAPPAEPRSAVLRLLPPPVEPGPLPPEPRPTEVVL